MGAQGMGERHQSGRFSSDRTIRDYAEQVWKLEPVRAE
ncbi:glycogen phosphorylase [Cutibacterium acnes JCM 18909]|nr:glycogen phosphorylase [Cutibacterium acnes JCM 18909]